MALAFNQPEQSPGYKPSKELTFIELVEWYRKQKGWTQVDLAEAANMSKTMVNRMMNNSNGRGGPFKLTEDVVTQLALAFKIGRTGRDKLLCAAFPERAYWLEALDSRESVISLNCRLYEDGLPMLGINNPKE